MVEIGASLTQGGFVHAASFVVHIGALAAFIAFLELICIGQRAVHETSFAIGLAILEQIGIGLFLRAS